MAQTIYRQSGEDFIVGDKLKLNLTSPTFEDFWKYYFEPAVKGHVAIYDGYGSDLIKTGNVVASIGSTAGVLFYSDIVTYDDNVTEGAEFLILTYPIIEGGENVALQRGGGMCIFKSDQRKEYAASLFLKWFTSPEQNLKFVSSTGYIPVTRESNNMIEANKNNIEDKKVRMLLQTTKEMTEEYSFFYTPIIENFDGLQGIFNENMKEYALECKTEYFNLLNTMNEKDAYNAAIKNKYLEFTLQR